MRVPATLVAAAVLAWGCSPRRFHEASPRALPTPQVSPTPQRLTWETLQEASTSRIPSPPWSVRGWPRLLGGGPGFRWIANERTVDGVSALPLSPWQQWKEMTFAASLPARRNGLSPAEKLTLLLGGTQALSPELKARLESAHDRLLGEPLVRACVEKLHDLTLRHLELWSHEQRRRSDIDGIVLALTEPPWEGMPPEPRRREKQELQRLLHEGELLSAGRLELRTAAERTLRRLERDGRGFFESTLDLARALAVEFPLLGESWLRWASAAADFSGQALGALDTRGWALASLVEKAPEAAVRARKNGQEIVFSDPEMRMLLAALWERGEPPPTDATLDPQVFHGALVEEVFRQQKGFALGTLREGQWEFEPLQGFKVDSLPLQRKGGLWSREPVPASELAFAAPVPLQQGVVSVAQLRVRVALGVPHAPRLQKPAGPEPIHERAYFYWFELDAQARVVAGHWGFAQPSALDEEARLWLRNSVPGTLVRISLPPALETDRWIRKIVSCSREGEPIRSRVVPFWEEVALVECGLD